VTRAVVFRPQAEREALDVRRWYEARRAGLGEEFGIEVDAVVARIVENPLLFPRVRGETRRAVLTRFPYALYFRLTAESIVVLAVHGRQDPSRWYRRA
jgi:plasmid stabilization system protein ParE